MLSGTSLPENAGHEDPVTIIMCLNHWIVTMLWVMPASRINGAQMSLAWLSLRGLFSGKAEEMSAELAHAEQVMWAHEKPHFSDKLSEKHKHKNRDVEGSNAKYSSLYSSFDELKPHEDLPPGLHKVFCLCRPTQIVIVWNYCLYYNKLFLTYC